MSQVYEVHPDIHRAHTLPADFYRDPRAFARLQAAFARSWQWVAEGSPPPGPGECVPFTLLPETVGEPLVLTRDDAGTLRCLSNVCTHRGNLVVNERCRPAELRCRYHGRRFDHRGRMTFMPGFEGVENFPAEEDHLPSVASAEVGPLVFVSLAGEPAFADWFAPVRERLPGYPWEALRRDEASTRHYPVNAHWALYCDNYLEGFHIPYVHAGLQRELEKDTYRTELFEGGSVQWSVARDPESGFAPDAGGAPGVAGYYFWLFPNLMLNVYPWGISVNVVHPLAPDRTRVSFYAYEVNPALRERGAGADLHRVELEDEEVVESVQRGVSGRLYRRGRFSPAHERGVHQFHRMLAQAVR